MTHYDSQSNEIKLLSATLIWTHIHALVCVHYLHVFSMGVLSTDNIYNNNI